VNPNDRVGTVLGNRYEIERLLGRGAMADVYKARDINSHKDVAVKILRQPLTRDREAMERFKREARVQEMVQHGNVAALYGGGVTEAGEPYLVVELLRGRSLRTVLKTEGKVDVVRAVSYCWQALQGLAAVHTVGILHRDLKPANLMLEPSPGPVERVVLIDFGFAALEGGAKLTMQGHVVGSLTYLAPERLRGEPGDERSDLYAIGVVLYELLAGRPPFMADDDYELINAHLSEKVPDIEQVTPGLAIPNGLKDVMVRALSKQPGQRPPSARRMGMDLEASMRGVG
jgi:eukaryotic-like serine/threonine-protein kinase